jgi:3-isopropylmalate/(R)-2-methylmalate dehydratase small subunit
VSSFFADIFKNNSMNIGILPVQVSEDFLDRIFKAIETDPQTQLEVDLSKQTITILTTGDSESFDINSYKKHNLMNGFDDIDYLQAMKEEISAFAQNSRY